MKRLWLVTIQVWAEAELEDALVEDLIHHWIVEGHIDGDGYGPPTDYFGGYELLIGKTNSQKEKEDWE